MNHLGGKNPDAAKASLLKLFLIGVLVVWGVIFLILVGVAISSTHEGDSFIEKVGQMGDSFGIFNALFSSVAVIFAIAAFVSQREQFNQQVKDQREQSLTELSVRCTEHLPAFELSLMSAMEFGARTAHSNRSAFLKFVNLQNTKVYNLVVVSNSLKVINSKGEAGAVREKWGVFPHTSHPQGVIMFLTDGDLQGLVRTGGVVFTFPISWKMESK